MITLRFYLDTRSVKAGEAAPVRLSVCRNSARAFINTGVRVRSSQWNKSQQRVCRLPQAAVMNSRLRSLLEQVEALVWDLHGKGLLRGLNATATKNVLVRALNHEDEEAERKVTLEDIMNDAVEAHSGQTRRLYASTVSRLKAWLKDDYPLVLPEDVNLAWLERFDAFLAKNAPSRNARNIHFKHIRAAFNRAIDHERVACYPFRRFKLRHEATAKRSLSLAQVRKIIHAELPARLSGYRDMWVLMLCLRGINIVDLYGLDGIDGNGYIRYVRAKTGRVYNVKLEPEALGIINRHRGRKRFLDFMDTHSSCVSYYNHLRVGLHEIAKMLNDMPDGVRIDKLTTYYARHTWATFGSYLDIPKETIAAGLGHGGNTVTDVYIDFDMRKVDAANRRILDYVFGAG